MTNMVPDMLAEMGIAQFVSAVTLSVEHGRLKSHLSIYRAALDAIGTNGGAAVFIGDSYEADYVGAIQAWMRAFLMDPAGRHDVPGAHRITSVLDLEVVALSSLGG